MSNETFYIRTRKKNNKLRETKPFVFLVEIDAGITPPPLNTKFGRVWGVGLYPGTRKCNSYKHILFLLYFWNCYLRHNIIVEFVFQISKVREWAYTRVEYFAWKLLESSGVGLYPKVGLFIPASVRYYN